MAHALHRPTVKEEVGPLVGPRPCLLDGYPFPRQRPTRGGINRSMPTTTPTITIHRIADLGPVVVIDRPRRGAGKTLIVLDQDMTVREVWPLARVLLDPAERMALWRALSGH